MEIAGSGQSQADGPFETESPAAARMSRMSRATSVADEVEMDLTPVPQEVSATVEARFTMSQPDFS